MSLKTQLVKKIEENTVTIGIVGLGYVGLPLAILFALKDISILGFDNSEEKIDKLSRGINYIDDIDGKDLRQVIKNGLFKVTYDFSEVKNCDGIIICVPTPLNSFKKPDMSFIEDACHKIGTFMKKGTFISLESTTYPTTTESFIKPILEKRSGTTCEKDFWLCYSPERIDPGNGVYNTENTPKVIGGLGDDATEIGLAIYEKVIETVVPVSSPRIAEMAKIVENTYRLVNISLINELAQLACKMEIDIWEVIEAAATKPFGFQPFYPGPGIGGHCIPVDPFYLEHIAEKYKFHLSMIHEAGFIDDGMPNYMFEKINFAMNQNKKPINGSQILFMGVAYKANTRDERESPALKIMDETSDSMAIVGYHDPYIPEATTPKGRRFKSLELSDSLVQEMDCVVLVTAHRVFDIKRIVENADIILDLRNATKGINCPNTRKKIYKL